MSHQNTRGAYSGYRGNGASNRQRPPFASDSFGSNHGMPRSRGKHSHDISRGGGSYHFNGKPSPKYVYRQKTPGPDDILDPPKAGGSHTREPECFVASDLDHGNDSKTRTTNVIPNLLEAGDDRMKQPDCISSSNSVCEGDDHLLPGPPGSSNINQDVGGLQISETPKKEKEDIAMGDHDFSCLAKVKNEMMLEEPQILTKADSEGQAFQEKVDKSLTGIGVSAHSVQHAMAKPFDICPSKTGTPVSLKPSLLVKNRQKRNEAKLTKDGEIGRVLGSGMVLLKNYLSITDQVKMVETCRNLGLGPGGFYQPGYRDGAQLHLKMMCLGRNWDPEKNFYEDIRRIDGAKPPIIPSDFSQLVKKAIEESHALIQRNSKVRNVEGVLPWMTPDICIVNFYSASGKLGLHQDRDETQESLDKGLPVVSFSIGDSAEFLYGDQRDVDKAQKVILESGDVLIFGGKSRHIFHGVSNIISQTTPELLLEETNFRCGRLNLTFRQY